MLQAIMHRTAQRKRGQVCTTIPFGHPPSSFSTTYNGPSLKNRHLPGRIAEDGLDAPRARTRPRGIAHPAAVSSSPTAPGRAATGKAEMLKAEIGNGSARRRDHQTTDH